MKHIIVIILLRDIMNDAKAQARRDMLERIRAPSLLLLLPRGSPQLGLHPEEVEMNRMTKY